MVKQKSLFEKEYSTFLTDNEATYIFERLKTHYHLGSMFLVFRGYRQRGACALHRIRLPHNPSVGLLGHEVAHALQLSKRRLGEDHRKHWHTNQHLKIMRRVCAYIMSHLDEGRNRVQQMERAKRFRLEEKIKRERERQAYRKMPEWKLEHLRKLEKKAITRFKRAETHLKKIQRRIKLMERRVQRQRQILSELEAQTEQQTKRLETLELLPKLRGDNESLD